MFTRSRCWLLPTVGVDLLRLHESVARTLDGRDVHRHYRPGAWQPHVTLARDARRRAAAGGGRLEVLPLPARLTRMVLVDTGTGEVHGLPDGP